MFKNVTDYFFSSVHFARGNLNSGIGFAHNKIMNSKAKLKAQWATHKPTSMAFGNHIVCYSRMAYSIFFIKNHLSRTYIVVSIFPTFSLFQSYYSNYFFTFIRKMSRLIFVIWLYRNVNF